VFARPGTAFDLVKSAISLFGFALSLIAVFAVLANNWAAGANPQQIITVYYFVLAILLGFLPGVYGLMGLVLLIPLSPNLHGQLNAWFGFTLLAQSNAGIDLAAGFFVGSVFRALFQTFFTRLNYADEDRFKAILATMASCTGFLGNYCVGFTGDHAQCLAVCSPNLIAGSFI
jgi:hypothetical protein